MANSIEIVLPDIGDYKDVPIVEINVAVGDAVTLDMPLLSVESDKATLEVPSSAAGTVRKLMVGVGTRVSQGSILMVLERQPATSEPPSEIVKAGSPPLQTVLPEPAPVAATAAEPAKGIETEESRQRLAPDDAHASPSVRALARELGVSLALVQPSGAKGRTLRDDITAYVKQQMGAGGFASPGAGRQLLEWPQVDFEQFGPVERIPLLRIQKLTGANLSRNWNMIRVVTNFDRADVTETDEFRKLVNGEGGKDAVKLTMVAMLIKSAALALKKYPRFNASLDQDELILKRYVHVGFAVDTPKGLVVPVIRDCDKKGLVEIAQDMRALADKAIEGKLPASDMQGGCFTVSSLGGVGGYGFTPIINAPEVAILGAGRAATEAVWNGSEFRPRLVLPISLSWDHRVVDGVAAAYFLGFVAATLSDLRRYAL